MEMKDSRGHLVRHGKLFTAVVGGALLLLVACSSGAGPAGSGSGASGERTIQIRAFDSLKFEPAKITVAVGDKVRFVVTNAGHTDHDFFVGDEQDQLEHEGAMEHGMEHEGGGMAALEVGPGETKEATVTFDQAGTILYGCHEPGHYDGGMVGTITVTE